MSMTKEQREAVDRLEKRIKDNKDYKTTQVWLTDDVVATQTALSLIKEQQEEIDMKDKQIDLMAELVYKRFKAELLLEYGFENEEQLKQYFAELVEKE